MSTTLSTSAMVTKLQQKFPMGIASAQWLDFLNEAFRKIDQMSEGGFIWQVKTATINLPPGFSVTALLPADFDPGKSAFLFGGPGSPTQTIIPYKPYSEFLNEQHFQATAIGAFSSWTFQPTFTFGPPTSYRWTMVLAPNSAFPLPGAITLPLIYHAVSYPPLTAAPNVYFPTPDEFDSLILDLAEAEARREYTASGWDKLAAAATQSLQELVGTYRTDRYDLAGIKDVTMQAQEKAAERDR